MTEQRADTYRNQTRVTIMVSTVLSAHEVDTGFAAWVVGSEARRQLRISVGVVVMLAIGIVSAALTVGSHPIAATRDSVAVSHLTTMHAETNAVGAKAI